jgi:hypothetical protein
MEGMKEKEVLINRAQMLIIAREYRIFVSKSTIHRWANEPGFPFVVGQDGRNLLYAHGEFVAFLRQRLKRIQEDR